MIGVYWLDLCVCVYVHQLHTHTGIYIYTYYCTVMITTTFGRNLSPETFRDDWMAFVRRIYRKPLVLMVIK